MQRRKRKNLQRVSCRNRKKHRANRICHLAAATGNRRSAGGKPRRRVPHHACCNRRSSFHRTIQFPQHGTQLDNTQRHSPRLFQRRHVVRAHFREEHDHTRARDQHALRCCLGVAHLEDRQAVKNPRTHPGLALGEVDEHDARLEMNFARRLGIHARIKPPHAPQGNPQCYESAF